MTSELVGAVEFVGPCRFDVGQYRHDFVTGQRRPECRHPGPIVFEVGAFRQPQLRTACPNDAMCSRFGRMAAQGGIPPCRGFASRVVLPDLSETRPDFDRNPVGSVWKIDGRPRHLGGRNARRRRLKADRPLLIRPEPLPPTHHTRTIVSDYRSLSKRGSAVRPDGYK